MSPLRNVQAGVVNESAALMVFNYLSGLVFVGYASYKIHCDVSGGCIMPSYVTTATLAMTFALVVLVRTRMRTRTRMRRLCAKA